MTTIEESSKVQHILEEIDRLITEMTLLKSQIATLGHLPDRTTNSIRETKSFGMWADREDMTGQSSREWLDELRKKQWS